MKKYQLLLFSVFMVTSGNSQVPHWLKMNAPYAGSMTNDILSDNATLFVATDSGLYGTTNDGNIWTKAIGIKGGPPVYSLNLRDLVWFATTAPIGITDVAILNKSTDGGVTWDSAAFIGSGYLLSNKNGLIQAGGLSGSLFRSTDDGKNWVWLDSSKHYSEQINPIALSDNFGLGLLDSEGVFSLITSIDFCSSWRNIPTNVTLLSGQFAIDGNSFLSGTSIGIYRSTDTGITWQLINTDVKSVHILPSNQIIYAYSDSLGILFSSDHGFTWTTMNDGLPNFKIRNITAGKDELYVGLASGELLHTSFPSSVNSTKLMTPLNFVVYPDPISIQGQINYYLQSRSDVSVTIYNSLGQLAETPVDQIFQEAGQQQIPIDLHELPPGIYDCRLSVNNEVQSAKFIITH